MIFYAITDRKRAGGDLRGQLDRYLALRPDWIQIREKDMCDRELLKTGSAFAEAARQAGIRLFVNGRPDIAALAGADGVHLPADSAPVEDVKRAFPSLLVVKSCHGLEEARAAGRSGADAVTIGPVFPTPSKEGILEPMGTAGLSEVCASAGVPVIALGGIGAENIVRLKGCGAAGVAGIRVFEESSPGELEGLRRLLE